MSGPADSIASFVSELQKEGVFAKAVDSGGIAFHSYCMLQSAPALDQCLQQVSFLSYFSLDLFVSSHDAFCKPLVPFYEESSPC